MVKEKSQRTLKYFELNENENIAYQIWDTAKTKLKIKLQHGYAYIRKDPKSISFRIKI